MLRVNRRTSCARHQTRCRREGVELATQAGEVRLNQVSLGDRLPHRLTEKLLLEPGCDAIVERSYEAGDRHWANPTSLALTYVCKMENESSWDSQPARSPRSWQRHRHSNRDNVREPAQRKGSFVAKQPLAVAPEPKRNGFVVGLRRELLESKDAASRPFEAPALQAVAQ